MRNGQLELELELELELIQTLMAKKPLLWVEVGAHVVNGQWQASLRPILFS